MTIHPISIHWIITFGEILESLSQALQPKQKPFQSKDALATGNLVCPTTENH